MSGHRLAVIQRPSPFKRQCILDTNGYTFLQLILILYDLDNALYKNEQNRVKDLKYENGCTSTYRLKPVPLARNICIVLQASQICMKRSMYIVSNYMWRLKTMHSITYRRNQQSIQANTKLKYKGSCLGNSFYRRTLLKGRYTICNCQRPVFSLGVSQHMKI